MWRRSSAILSVVLVSMMVAMSVSANNAWDNYHWGGTSTPVPLTLEDNLDSSWSTVLGTVVGDWDDSDALNLTIGSSADNGTSNCEDPLADAVPTNSGQIGVCNGAYVGTGWLGVARIWIAADGTHIEAGIAAVNDSYLVGYNAYARQQVLCQEVGHAFGLDHQSSRRKQSCMNDRWGLGSMDFVSPNSHDYSQLGKIYSHLNETTGDTGGGKGGPPCDRKPNHHHCPESGSPGSPYSVKRLANGQTVVTWITWATGYGQK